MKLKSLFLSIMICITFTIKADWRSRIILFANDNGIWKVLLRHDPQADIWTDFNRNGTSSSMKADRFAAQFLPKQIAKNYQLSQKDISPI